MCFRLTMIGALTATLPLAPLHAAEFKAETSNGKAAIKLTGKILPGDAGKFAAAVNAAKTKGHNPTAVILDSPGGAFSDSVKIAQAVRQAKMTTVVPDRAQCNSGCFTIFAGGTERVIGPSSVLAVHGAGLQGRETEGAKAATVTMARFLRTLGVSPTVIGKIVITPHDKFVVLTAWDLRDMGVTIAVASPLPGTGPKTVTAAPVATAAPAQNQPVNWPPAAALDAPPRSPSGNYTYGRPEYPADAATPTAPVESSPPLTRD